MSIDRPESWRTNRAEGVPWRSGPAHPLVGITADLAEPTPGSLRATCAMTYARAVTDAGGIPMILPPIPELAAEHARQCHAFILTGGDDPRTEPFGEPTHAKATLVHPLRQAYETALLDALTRRTEAPVLGVCLGMQMMALHAGGRLNQHLPDTVPTAERHANNAIHPIRPVESALSPLIARGEVTSSHRQAVTDPGRLRVIAVADDGVIEAIDDPSHRFFLGVQWHPERTADPGLGIRLFERLIEAARRVPT